MWVNLSMPRPDLSRLTPAEKDALILALLDRVAALEAKLGEPPKTLRTAVEKSATVAAG
jgi:transposase InsO family protein